jgi:hypothetical protein
MADEIRRLLADELGEGCEESWERVTDDPDIRCVTVGKITLGEFPYWSVGVAVAEFLRADPLESELRQQMAAALRAVDGAESVTGAVSGGALVRAAAGVVDRLADRARSYLASRG